MITVKHDRVALIHLLIAVTGTVGLQLTDAMLPNIYAKWGAVGVFCIILSFIILGRNKRVHVFRPGSRELEMFFAEWYRMNGDLTIYCNDLDWLKLKDVDESLTVKADRKQLYLYLSEVCDKAIRLKGLGAQVFQIPSVGGTAHKFSILRTDGFERIICRSKSLEAADTKGELIEFIETTSVRDPYLIALARDVLSISKKHT